MTAFVYLLHFDRHYPGGQSPRHYLGVARDVDDRLREHQNGSSKSRLTRACKEKGIEVEVVRTWTFPYPKAAFDFERAVKAKKASYSCLCPLCKDAKHPLAGMIPERIVLGGRCACRVSYLSSGRRCTKTATWRIGDREVCGVHARALVFISKPQDIATA